MTSAADKVLQDAMKLPDRERAEVVARLIESLEAGPDADDDELERAWALEIERRCAALDAGETATTSWDALRRRIEDEILNR